jgi:hypothetical protein
MKRRKRANTIPQRSERQDGREQRRTKNLGRTPTIRKRPHEFLLAAANQGNRMKFRLLTELPPD